MHNYIYRRFVIYLNDTTKHYVSLHRYGILCTSHIEVIQGVQSVAQTETGLPGIPVDSGL